ncbi:MAG: beta-ACP synthase [Bacteroidales bacterium]|nr:beta-ACP synthase [Bacteroidales bacterium]
MEYPVIYLTADAMISSLGFSTGECREEMLRYQSGLHPICDSQFYSELFYGAKIDNDRLRLLVGEHNLHDFSRLEQLLILSIRQTLVQSGIDVHQSDCGLILASTKGNVSRLSAENETGDELFLSHSAERVASYFGFTTRPIVICNACISGVSAMIVAKRLIENGRFKHIVVAGGDELSNFIVTGFHAFKSVSADRCKPYDADRDGLSLGEACGSILLTTEKRWVTGKEPIVLLGGAITNDANHISGPSRTGEELHLAIEQALAQAGISGNDGLFVNAHGTATIYNDEMESKALHLSRLSEKPVQSLKPYFGHTLGAAGVIETIICKQQLENDILFGVLGFQTIGVPYPLHIDASHRPVELTYCLKTASGFGGCNAAIVIGKRGFSSRLSDQFSPLATKNGSLPSPERATIVSRCTINASGVELNGERQLVNELTDDFPTFIRKAYHSLNLNYRKFYKMDDLSKLGFITTSFLTRSIERFSELPPESKGIVMANCSSSLDTDIHYRRNLDAVGDREASPALFVYTLPNVMLGEICIYWKMKGENTFFIQRECDKEFLLKYAEIAMKEQNLGYCIVGWCDLLGDNFLSDFYLMER